MTRKRRNNLKKKSIRLNLNKIQNKTCKSKKYNSVYGGRMTRTLFF